MGKKRDYLNCLGEKKIIQIVGSRSEEAGCKLFYNWVWTQVYTFIFIVRKIDRQRKIQINE